MTKVLVVDDSPTVRAQVREALESQGIGVLEAFEGKEALEKLTGDDSIKLVICDVNMPGMNGLDLLDSLGRSGLLPALPVLMLTTEGAPASIARARKAGARGWLVKPFRAALLLAAVRKLIATS